MPRANIIPKTVQLISELHRMAYAKTLLLAAAFSTALFIFIHAIPMAIHPDQKRTSSSFPYNHLS